MSHISDLNKLNYDQDALIRIREDELELQEREEMFKVCEETFNSAEKKEEKAPAFKVIRRVTGEYNEDDDDDTDDDDPYNSSPKGTVSSDKKENSNISKSV